MVAMSLWGFILTWTWIGALVLVLLAKAVWVWFKFRYAERSAAHARRLVEVTKASRRPPVAEPGSAKVLAFRSGMPSGTPGARSKAGP
jgi:hypothetical protein